MNMAVSPDDIDSATFQETPAGEKYPRDDREFLSYQSFITKHNLVVDKGCRKFPVGTVLHYPGTHEEMIVHLKAANIHHAQRSDGVDILDMRIVGFQQSTPSCPVPTKPVKIIAVPQVR